MMELTGKLLELIAKLEGLAPHVWAVTVRQVYVEAITDGMWLLLWAILAASFLHSYVGIRAKESNQDDDWEGLGWSIAATLCIIMSLVPLNALLTRLLNPQWAAIKLWLGMIQ